MRALLAVLRVFVHSEFERFTGCFEFCVSSAFPFSFMSQKCCLKWRHQFGLFSKRSRRKKFIAVSARKMRHGAENPLRYSLKTPPLLFENSSVTLSCEQVPVAFTITQVAVVQTVLGIHFARLDESWFCTEPLRAVTLFLCFLLLWSGLHATLHIYAVLRTVPCHRPLLQWTFHTKNHSAHFSSVLPRRTRTHTHTRTQFFPSLAKSGEQQKKKKKPAVYVVGLTPLGIFFWKRVVCTCQLLLYKGVIYSRDHMQIPSAKHQRNGPRRVKTDGRYFKASRVGKQTQADISKSKKKKKKNLYPASCVR